MLLRSLLLLFLAAGWAVAQEPVAPKSDTPPKTTYETLLEKVKQQDQKVDFSELRMTYTETAAYSPYGGDAESRKAMFAALKAQEYEKVLASAEQVLAKNYLDINGHFGCFAAHRRLGHEDKAAYHRYVFEGLLNSIKNSGDGLTMEKAFVVISTDEEYAYFNWIGLRVSQQALIKEGEHDYDKMTATNPDTNQSVDYYFNIDKPFKWLSKSLKP